jgi:hypothetical protein
MGICPVGGEFFQCGRSRMDGQTDRHDEASSRSSRICEERLINGKMRCINLS